MIQVRPLQPKRVLLAALGGVPEFRVLMESPPRLCWPTHPVERGVARLRALARRVGAARRHAPPLLAVLRRVWLASHVATVAGIAAYVYLPAWHAAAYAAACYGAVVTYLLVVCRQLLAAPAAPVSLVLGSENCHLLVLALLVASGPPNVAKVVSFGIYSAMNLWDCVASGTLKCLEHPLLLVAAYADLAVAALFVREAVAAPHRLAIYGVSFGLRVESLQYCRTAFDQSRRVVVATVRRCAAGSDAGSGADSATVSDGDGEGDGDGHSVRDGDGLESVLGTDHAQGGAIPTRPAAAATGGDPTHAAGTHAAGAAKGPTHPVNACPATAADDFTYLHQYWS